MADKAPVKKRTGRPSGYNAAIAKRICDGLSSGKSLISVLKGAGMPVATTVFAWLREHPEFLNDYTRAKVTGCEVLAAEIIAISDTCRVGKITKTDKDGTEVTTKDMIERSRL